MLAETNILWTIYSIPSKLASGQNGDLQKIVQRGQDLNNEMGFNYPTSAPLTNNQPHHYHHHHHTNTHTTTTTLTTTIEVNLERKLILKFMMNL